MRVSGFLLLFVLNRQNFFRLPNRTEWCILIFFLHKFHLFRFVLKKQYQNSTGNGGFLFRWVHLKICNTSSFLSSRCRFNSDTFPTFRLWHLTLLWWFLYTDYSTKALWVSRGNIAAHKACAGSSVEALRNLKVSRRIWWCPLQFHTVGTVYPHKKPWNACKDLGKGI